MVTSWENTTLEKITSVITKGTTPTSIGKSFTLTGINFIKIECIDKSGQFDKSMFEHIDVETNNILKRSQLNDGDILFSIAGALGRIAIIDESVLPANTNQALAIIRLKKAFDVPNRRYVYYQLQSERTKRIIEEINVSGAQANLSLDNISNLIIPIPEDVKEQERIAEALSDVDSMILSLEKLIAKKKAVKQGAMQELLTGKKRLPGFTGDWEDYTIGKMGEFYSGLSGKSKKDFDCGEAHYITFLNVLSNVKIDTSILAAVDVKEGEMQNAVKKGDLFFNTSSETPEEVGMCAVLDEELENTYLNSFCFGFRFFDDTHNPLFLSYYLNSAIGRKTMSVLAQGATRYNLSKNNFAETVIKLPTKEEQTAIASILSNMDNEIEALEQKLDKTRQIKQGMMQQLLTGKIRLV